MDLLDRSCKIRAEIFIKGHRTSKFGKWVGNDKTLGKFRISGRVKLRHWGVATSLAGMTAVQRQWLQFTGLLIVGLLLLWLALKGQDLTAIGAEMARARWEWIGLGLLLTLVGHVSRARRWQLLIRASGHEAGLMACFMTMMTGYLSNLGIPRIGEINRCVALNRLSGAPVLALGGTVVAERAVDMLTLGVLVVAAMFGMGSQASVFFFDELMQPLFAALSWKLVFVACLGIIGLVVLYGVAFRRRNSNRPGWSSKIQGWAKEIWNGLMAALKLRPKALFEFTGHTLLIWLSYYSAPFCTLMALQVDSTNLSSLAFYVFIFGSLSRTVPLPAGSAGAYHYIVSGWMMFLGYSQLVGLSVATLNHAVQTVFYLLFGAFGLMGFFILLRMQPSKNQSQPISNNKTPTL